VDNLISSPSPAIEEADRPVACVFAFNLDFDGSGDTFTRFDDARSILFSAVARANSRTPLSFQVRHGALTYYNEASRPTRVHIAGINDKDESPRTRRGTTTYSIDATKFLALTLELIESLKEDWNSLESRGTAAWTFATKRVTVWTLSNLPLSVVKQIDHELKHVEAYLGAAVIDLGNPLQFRALVDDQLLLGIYQDGNLVFPFEVAANYELPDSLWNEFERCNFDGISIATVFIDDLGINFVRKQRSERGSRSFSLLQNVRSDTFGTRMLGELQRLDDSQVQRSLDIDDSILKLKPVVPKEKLTEYILNPDHDEGKHKAHLFKTLLGIELDDWEYLSVQFELGLINSQPLSLRDVKEYGDEHHLQFEVHMPIIGRNEEVMVVRTAWKIVDGGPPSLVTAYLGNQNLLDDLPEPVDLLILAPSGTEEFYQRLWQKASDHGDARSAELVPRPMFIGNGDDSDKSRDVVPEGEFGSAYVRTFDARRSFGKWLKTNGYGGQGHKSGTYVRAPGDSLQKSIAWCEGFQEVLQANHVLSETVSYID